MKLLTDPIEVIAQNSFANFHAKGFDYLCLQRSAELTVKAYFFEDTIEKSSPEFLCPHDHRYAFSTKVLSGHCEHFRYSEYPIPRRLPVQRPAQLFDWNTPLNGGSGFTWNREAILYRQERELYHKGQSYWCDHHEIHTIGIHIPKTVLLLVQHADVLPVGSPTRTFVPGSDREPPSLDGLYDRMTEDRAIQLLTIIDSLT